MLKIIALLYIDLFLSGDSNASFESNSSYGSTLGGKRKRRESIGLK